jgi:LacI family transcriptional regulator
VVGIDNIEMSAHVFPSLTSVHLPVGRIGDIAANCLLKELAGGSAHASIGLPIELVPRKSSAAVSRTSR